MAICGSVYERQKMMNDNDFYPAPHSMVKLLANYSEWESLYVWEPCAGDFRLVEALQARDYKVIATDISQGQDFFDFKEAPCPHLMTNPPFKKIRPFIDHAFAIGVERMVLVCPERLWACKKGWEQFHRHRPARFINLNWREDYLGKGGSPDRALAISIWESPHASRCQYEVWSKPYE